MRAIGLCLVWALAVPAVAEDLAAALTRPISPGALALLIEHGRAPEAQARLREGLADKRPEVRAAASRVIYAAGIRELVPDVVRALEAETVPGAITREHLRTIAVVDPVAGEAGLFAAAKRLPDQNNFIGTLLGRAYAGPGIGYLRRLRETGQGDVLRFAFVRSATRHGRADLSGAAALALAEQDPTAWRAVCEGAREGGTLADAFIAESIASPAARIRATTYWYLASRGMAVLPEAVLRALETAPEAESSAGVTITITPLDARDAPADQGRADAAFAHELFSRARGREARENLAWMERWKTVILESLWSRMTGRPGTPGPAAPDRLDVPGPIDAVYSLFTAGERAFLPPEERLRRPEAKAGPEPLLLSAARGFTPGYVGDLSRVTGCLPKKRLEARAQMEYDALGHPMAMPGGKSPFSAECTELLRLLLASSYLPDDERSDAEPGIARAVRVVLPDKEELECLASHGPTAKDELAAEAPRRVGGGIREPKKVHHQNPRYPEGAKERRVQGVVIIEATIDACGRPVDLRLLRSPSPDLAQAAFDAVHEWRYAPSLVDGYPASIVMTVTLTFRLQ